MCTRLCYFYLSLLFTSILFVTDLFECDGVLIYDFIFFRVFTSSVTARNSSRKIKAFSSVTVPLHSKLL